MYEKTDRMRDHDGASLDGPSGQVDAGEQSVERAGREMGAPAPPGDATPLFDKVDDASDDSFPASDAPAWTGMRAGSPRTDQ